MTTPLRDIDHNGFTPDAHVNAGLALGQLIAEILSQINARLDRIEAKDGQLPAGDLRGLVDVLARIESNQKRILDRLDAIEGIMSGIERTIT